MTNKSQGSQGKELLDTKVSVPKHTLYRANVHFVITLLK